ncbi:MAG: hypothetical protein LC637_03820 [Xanthomonadaceae bacterium]|nr:hypothetical protein [Xanthomonadaceae bacterium]
MFSEHQIQSLIDHLLARHEALDPLDLLLAAGRLSRTRLDHWQRQETSAWLEDSLAGDPQRAVELLQSAAAIAERLELEPHTPDSDRQPNEVGQPKRLFRNPAADRLARTHWRRNPDTPQLNLFFDNRFNIARADLVAALVAGEVARAEIALAEMAGISAANDLQGDAELLVENLPKLHQPIDDPQGWLDHIEHIVVPAARRVMTVQADRWLEAFWQKLGCDPAARHFDAANPQLHVSAIAARYGDWTGVIDAVRAVPDHAAHPVLLQRLAHAALMARDRPVALEALARLCWSGHQLADRLIQEIDDPQLADHRDRFFDLEGTLELADFPAWLVLAGHAMPNFEPWNSDAQDAPAAHWRTYAASWRLAHNPEDIALRTKLRQRHPELFRIWLGARRI